jgi:hypothetical protein
MSRIGYGALGGKAASLVRVEDRILSGLDPAECPDFAVSVPRMVVLATDVFESFMDQGELRALAMSDAPDDRIALAFQQAEIPPWVAGDLRALATEVHVPLAVRSSSLLEDALAHPFAGVYGTKMIPSNAADPDRRFRGLVEAIKFVWASTFFAAPKAYAKSIDRDVADERMAVIVQEVVGQRHNDRFYPTVSGVARSWNYYPMEPALPEHGVLSLALGLGKTIVDGGVAWTISPEYPARPMPFGNARALLRWTQRDFWAVHMGTAPPHDPIRETEHMVQADLGDAEYDDTLRRIASTYDGRSDRMFPGVGRDGPRVIDFAPLLGPMGLPLADTIKRLLRASEAELGGAVEIEFALDLEPGSGPHRLGFLQVRPMAVEQAEVDVPPEALDGDDVLIATDRVLGNGRRDDIADVVFIDPDAFERSWTSAMAAEVELLDIELRAQARPYLLLGFGRWGSSDPWLGIPVDWSRIAGARVVVETSIGDMNPDPSQGSHFFQNLIAFGVLYMTLGRREAGRVEWKKLKAGSVPRGQFVRHLRLERPLSILADGRSGRAVVRHG